MYARIERKKVCNARAVLTANKMSELCRDMMLDYKTVCKYLADIYNENSNSPQRNKVLCAAINDYGARIEKKTTYKNVVVIDEYDCKENHQY